MEAVSHMLTHAAVMSLLVFFNIGIIRAEVSLPAILSDHMVLQRDAEVPIWGWADPGEVVTVSIADQTVRTVADASGVWRVRLGPMSAQPVPLEMTVSGTNRLVVRDILVGEVWLASGQSNMQFSLSSTDTAATEVPQAGHPLIRIFAVPRRTALEPRADVSGKWQICTPASASGFSAVAYFFGRELHRTLDVPVGLIGSSWGGTNAEEWTPWERLEGVEEFQPILDRWRGAHPEVKALFTTSPALSLEVADLVFVPRGSGDPELLLDDFDDGDLRTALFGTWINRSSARGCQLAVAQENSAGPRFLRLTGTAAVGSEVRVAVHYTPGRATDFSRYRGLRMRLRGQGHLKFHSLQPTVSDSDNYTAALIPLSENWRTLTVDFEALRQAGWGKRQPFTGESLQGAVFEVLPTDRPIMRPPSGLFNGMIRPLVPMGLGGVIWYQGEGNAGRARQYRRLLPAMIEGWREAFEQDDLRFLIVQLPNFRSRKAEPAESDWAELREAQLLTYRSVSNTGLAVTIDLGEPDDVHPRSKAEVGRRLAAWAFGGIPGLGASLSGPLFRSHQVEGRRLRIWFDHAGTGLVAAGGPPLRGFAVAGADRRFHWARAEIEGDHRPGVERCRRSTRCGALRVVRQPGLQLVQSGRASRLTVPY
jgi:sialate O-acetylesterase